MNFAIPRKKHLVRALYALVLAAMVTGLAWLGPEPWQKILLHWKTFLLMVVTITIGVLIQVASFRAVVPERCAVPDWLEMTRIWSLSGAVSIVAPFMAGLGTRTALLVHSGMPLPSVLAASARQAWMGTEYALLIGGFSALFSGLKHGFWIATGLLGGWAVFAVTRVATKSDKRQFSQGNRMTQWLKALREPVQRSAHLWSIGQLAVMGTTYFIALAGLGTDIGWLSATLLASISILASLLVFLPNGIGVMDAIWIIAASQSHLSLSSSVAFALMLRIGFLVSTLVLLMVSFSVFLARNHNSG